MVVVKSAPDIAANFNGGVWEIHHYLLFLMCSLIWNLSFSAVMLTQL